MHTSTLGISVLRTEQPELCSGLKSYGKQHFGNSTLLATTVTRWGDKNVKNPQSNRLGA